MLRHCFQGKRSSSLGHTEPLLRLSDSPVGRLLCFGQSSLLSHVLRRGLHENHLSHALKLSQHFPAFRVLLSRSGDAEDAAQRQRSSQAMFGFETMAGCIRCSGLACPFTVPPARPSPSLGTLPRRTATLHPQSSPSDRLLF